jgi:hypothetical protein
MHNPVEASINSAKSLFRFTMTIPDPMDSNRSPIGEKSGLSQGTQNTAGGRKPTESLPPITVEGMVLYYPYAKGSESRPNRTYIQGEYANDGDGDDAAVYVSATDEAETGNKVPDTGFFHIFWQDRLVPESLIHKRPRAEADRELRDTGNTAELARKNTRIPVF